MVITLAAKPFDTQWNDTTSTRGVPHLAKRGKQDE